MKNAEQVALDYLKEHHPLPDDAKAILSKLVENEYASEKEEDQALDALIALFPQYPRALIVDSFGDYATPLEYRNIELWEYEHREEHEVLSVECAKNETYPKDYIDPDSISGKTHPGSFWTLLASPPSAEEQDNITVKEHNGRWYALNIEAVKLSAEGDDYIFDGYVYFTDKELISLMLASENYTAYAPAEYLRQGILRAS